MAVVLAIYGFVDLILLLAAKLIKERVKPIFHSLGISEDLKRPRDKEKATEGACHLEEPTMRIVRINAKGQVTIPAELRERFGIKKGMRIDWKADGHRLVLTPVPRLRKKS